MEPLPGHGGGVRFQRPCGSVVPELVIPRIIHKDILRFDIRVYQMMCV